MLPVQGHLKSQKQSREHTGLVFRPEELSRGCWAGQGARLPGGQRRGPQVGERAQSGSATGPEPTTYESVCLGQTAPPL